MLPLEQKAVQLYGQNFLNKLIAGATALNINPYFFLVLFQIESGMRSTKQNTAFPFKNGLATGLNQMTPNTLTRWGLLDYQFKAFPAVKQLDYIFDYYAADAPQIANYNNLLDQLTAFFLVNFFPVAIPHIKDNNYIFKTSKISAANVANNNPAFDLNKDHVLTMAEYKKAVANVIKKYPELLSIAGTTATKNKTPYILGGLALSLILFAAYRKFKQ
jgi:hypothetical protein